MDIHVAYAVSLVLLVGCNPPNSDNKRGSTIARNSSGDVTKACPLTLTATVSRNTFRPDEPVMVRVETNFSGGVVYLEEPDFFHNLSPEVWLPSGKLAAFSTAGGDYFTDHVGGSVQRGCVKNHVIDKFEFPLSKLFDLAGEGQYTVRFSLQAYSAPESPDRMDPRLVKPDFVGTVLSNTVTFQVHGDR